MNRYAHKFHLHTIQHVGQLTLSNNSNSISSGNAKRLLLVTMANIAALL